MYLPALMRVLELLKNSGEYEERRWYQVMKKRCNALNIKLDESLNPHEDAQKLLKSPLSRMLKSEGRV